MKINKPITQILFVCIGNICRSPFAQRLFTKLADQGGHKGFHADSAGLLALPGNAAPFLAQKAAAEYGVDLADHRAKPVSGKLVHRSDLILVMEESHKVAILEEFPGASDKTFLIRSFARFGSKDRGVADPYGLEFEAYRFCYLDIEDAVSGLLNQLLKLRDIQAG